MRHRRILLYAVCGAVLAALPGSGVAETLPAGPAVTPSPATYDDFLRRAWVLPPGATRAEIVASLGTPAEQGETFLLYSLVDLPGFPGLPGPIGVQVFPEVRIDLNDGRFVAPIVWSWMDTIGSPPVQPKSKRK